jgi:hypothetical protein
MAREGEGNECAMIVFSFGLTALQRSSGFRFGKMKLHWVRSIEHNALGGFAVIAVMALVLVFETVTCTRFCIDDGDGGMHCKYIEGNGSGGEGKGKIHVRAVIHIHTCGKKTLLDAAWNWCRQQRRAHSHDVSTTD